jgi:hypothetical protein
MSEQEKAKASKVYTKDSATTAHLEKALATGHIQAKLEPAPAQPPTTESSATAQPAQQPIEQPAEKDNQSS